MATVAGRPIPEKPIRLPRISYLSYRYRFPNEFVHTMRFCAKRRSLSLNSFTAFLGRVGYTNHRYVGRFHGAK